jgi:hypothetical protein
MHFWYPDLLAIGVLFFFFFSRSRRRALKPLRNSSSSMQECITALYVLPVVSLLPFFRRSIDTAYIEC